MAVGGRNSFHSERGERPGFKVLLFGVSQNGVFGGLGVE